MKLADPWFLLLLVAVVPLVLLYWKGKIGKDAGLKYSSVELVRSSGARNLSFRRIALGFLRGSG